MIFESTSFLAELLSRYDNIERHYLGRPLNGVSELEKAVIDVYKAILEYAAAIRTANKENRFRMTSSSE